MTRVFGRMRVLALLAAFAAFAPMLQIARVAAEPCAVRTELTGDRAAVERVSVELERLGVQIGAATPGCPAVRANVELDREGGIAVAVVDGARRSEGRVVSDAGIAAAWIDSFLRDDVEGFQRDRAVATTVATTAPSATRVASTAVRDAPASARSVPLLERFGASAGFLQSWPEGDATARGIAAATCLRLGRACIGAKVQYASEPDRTVNSTAMSRNDTSALATGSLAFELGHIRVAPELGLGVGRRSTRRLDCEPAPPPNCDPTTPNCPAPDGSIPPSPTDPNNVCETAGAAKLYVGDRLHAITYTPRFTTGLRVAVPLFDHVWLEGVASFELAPFGHSADFTTIAADGTASSETALPGEPTNAFHLGVGVRVGVP